MLVLCVCRLRCSRRLGCSSRNFSAADAREWRRVPASDRRYRCHQVDARTKKHGERHRSPCFALLSKSPLQNVDDSRRAELEDSCTQTYGLEEHLASEAYRQCWHRDRSEAASNNRVAEDARRVKIREARWRER